MDTEVWDQDADFQDPPREPMMEDMDYVHLPLDCDAAVFSVIHEAYSLPEVGDAELRFEWNDESP